MQYVANHDSYERAAALIAEHGAGALALAVERASIGHARGNPLDYSRWFCVGRAILMIQDPEPHGALH